MEDVVALVFEPIDNLDWLMGEHALHAEEGSLADSVQRYQMILRALRLHAEGTITEAINARDEARHLMARADIARQRGPGPLPLSWRGPR